MARSRQSAVIMVAALLGMLAQLGVPRSSGFVPPRNVPSTPGSSTAPETYMDWDGQALRDRWTASAQANSSSQGFASFTKVCATVMLAFTLVLGVMVPQSHAKSAEQLVREALKNPKGAAQQQKPVEMPAQEPAPPAAAPVSAPPTAAAPAAPPPKPIEAPSANLQKDASGTAQKEPEKPVVKKDASEKAQSESRAAVLEEAAKKQRERAEKLLAEEKQKEKAAANLQKLEKKKSAERLVREALENAKADKIKTSTEPKEQQAAELKQLSDQRAQEKEQDDKQDALRLKILKDLEKRKADAEKAAAEAEAIAQKIEQLAKDARRAAIAAKDMASALR